VTSQQEAEGKSKVGAADRRESTPAMGGRNAGAMMVGDRKSALAPHSRGGAPVR